MLGDIITWLNQLPFWGVYVMVLVLTAMIYKIAFARELPVLKSALVYLSLAIGCFLLAFMQILRFPIIQILFITAIIIGLTRVRLSYNRSKQAKQE
ncbi:YlaH-like family protein [Hazenella coriacea]|uniref:YlaH-like protein n=1 Tax=Hazenella coriacea TaxID=1179467 RepID=A0A4R3L6G3_9BACL|nr:YlaH-like family protein [Hazenella coriacea]TCS94658.1 YlaH-like protein [Hazenella coriacea]